MALTNWNDILNKPNGIDEVPEIALTVEQLSASVLSISEDVGEIALDVSQLSASVLSIGGDIQELDEKTDNISSQLFFGNGKGKNYTNTATTIDDLISVVSPTTDDDGYFTINNTGNITDFGNRQFAFGYVNANKKYGWIFVCSHTKIQVGNRINADTFTMHNL